jgi:hypothetical protein
MKEKEERGKIEEKYEREEGGDYVEKRKEEEEYEGE